MDKMLDRDVHQLFKAPYLSNYLPSNASVAAKAGQRSAGGHPMPPHTDYTVQVGGTGPFSCQLFLVTLGSLSSGM